jgi:nitrogen fixation protein FixH
VSHRRRVLFFAVVLISLAMIVGCSQKERPPQAQAGVASKSADNAGPWRLELKISPEHPSMTKPMALALHITDEHGQPVNDAKVNGSLSMKLMDMGVLAVKFDPKGSGDYEALMKSVDMSGPWNLAVEATQGGKHMKKNFDVNVFD